MPLAAPLPGWLLLRTPSSSLTARGLPNSDGLEAPSPQFVSIHLPTLETPDRKPFLRLSAQSTASLLFTYKAQPRTRQQPWFRCSFRCRARKQTSRHDVTFDFPLPSVSIRSLTISEAAQHIPVGLLRSDSVFMDCIREGEMGALEAKYGRVHVTGLLDALEVAGEDQKEKLLGLARLLDSNEYVYFARSGEEFWAVAREGDIMKEGLWKEKEVGWTELFGILRTMR